jgi:hypothetical protein
MMLHGEMGRNRGKYRKTKCLYIFLLLCIPLSGGANNGYHVQYALTAAFPD